MKTMQEDLCEVCNGWGKRYLIIRCGVCKGKGWDRRYLNMSRFTNEQLKDISQRSSRYSDLSLYNKAIKELRLRSGSNSRSL